MSTPGPPDHIMIKGLHYNAHILLERWLVLREWAAGLDVCRECHSVEDLQQKVDDLERQYPTKEIR